MRVSKLYSKFFLGVAALGMAVLSHREIAEPVWGTELEEFVPRPEVASLASFGFDALLADYYWLRAVQVAGTAHHPSAYQTYLGRIIDVVTTLDPWVDHPYRFAAVWLTDSLENVELANRLLERGILHHPSEWRNRFYLGFNHFFYFGDNRLGANILETAQGLPGAPVYLGRLVARLRAQDSDIDVAAAFLAQLVEDASDEYARAEYQKALDEVETERRARFLDAAREEYRRRRGRDIVSTEDLLAGPEPVLRGLPLENHGWEWVVDEESGQIVSSYYGERYQVHIHKRYQEKVNRMRRERREAMERRS